MNPYRTSDLIIIAIFIGVVTALLTGLL